MSDEDTPAGESKSKPASTPATGPDSGRASKADATSGPAERMDLPKWNRARVKRKQPAGELQEDAFQSRVREAGRQAITRAPVVIGCIVLVGGLIAGGVWWRDHRAEMRAAATRTLAQAASAGARGTIDESGEDRSADKLPPPNPIFSDASAQAEQVERSLTELASARADSDANTVGQLIRASQLMAQLDYPAAKNLYEQFLAAHPKHELLFLAQEGLALAWEGEGALDQALEALTQLEGEPGDFYRDQALFHRGRLLEAQGKTDEALAVYKQYVDEYPFEQDSLARANVVARLKELAPGMVPQNLLGFDPAQLLGGAGAP